jgi:hypothetical protein
MSLRELILWCVVWILFCTVCGMVYYGIKGLGVVGDQPTIYEGEFKTE